MPNTEAGDRRLFSAPDYVVFALSLAVPLGIGVFFWIRGRKNQSTEDFLMGGRSMNFIAVALSLLASVLNSVFVIGAPAEIHYYGIRFVYQFFALLIAIITVSHIFVARYQAMMFTSAYEYVERRYNMATRIVASCLFCLSVIIFLAVVLYVPALAFAEVTHLSIYVTIVITGIICTVYTTIGGLKAVVWTDALQMVLLLGGLVAIAAIGSAKLGGAAVVWNTATLDGRTIFNDFNPDPRARSSFWSQTLGTGVVQMGVFISNQMMVQRYMSVSSSVKAQSVLYIAVAMYLPLVILIAFIGLTLHTYYSLCDPLVSQRITVPDQIFPLYIMDLMGDYYGVPGLIMSSIFAAALSSVSSVINALSAVVLEDFICPAMLHFANRKPSERTRKRIAIGVVIFFGILTIALSFVADKFTSKIVQATYTIWGVIGGPLAGIFIMGFLLPFVNAWGAISGMIGGLIIALWICVGNLIYAPSPPTLPIGTCQGPGIVVPLLTESLEDFPLMPWYQISYAWYGVVGTGSCMIIGIIVSLLTKGYQRSYMESIRPSLMFSVSDNCCCCFPMSCIICYRCGVKYDDEVKHNQVLSNFPPDDLVKTHPDSSDDSQDTSLSSTSLDKPKGEQSKNEKNLSQSCETIATQF